MAYRITEKGSMRMVGIHIPISTDMEENIPVEIRGCTAFAYSKDGNIIYGRNNDLPPYLKKGSGLQ